MPASDGLGESGRPYVKPLHELVSHSAPQMSSGARDAVKEYGGWTDMVQSYGGKAHEMISRRLGRSQTRWRSMMLKRRRKGSKGSPEKPKEMSGWGTVILDVMHSLRDDTVMGSR